MPARSGASDLVVLPAVGLSAVLICRVQRLRPPGESRDTETIARRRGRRAAGRTRPAGRAAGGGTPPGPPGPGAAPPRGAPTPAPPPPPPPPRNPPPPGRRGR